MLLVVEVGGIAGARGVRGRRWNRLCDHRRRRRGRRRTRPCATHAARVYERATGGTRSWTAVAAAGIAAIGLLLIGERAPLAPTMTSGERRWKDLEERIQQRGALGLDALEHDERELVRMAAPCMELAQLVARTGNTAELPGWVEVRPLADACASAARRLEDGFSMRARDAFAASACDAEYTAMLSPEERELFEKAACHTQRRDEASEPAPPQIPERVFVNPSRDSEMTSTR